MSNSPSIILEKLKIIGVDKNYEIKFREGINVIWGDVDCGKSSILNIISYCLGASSIDTYDELDAKARSCQVFARFNGVRYIFERDLFDKDQYIKCHKEYLSEDKSPRILSPSINKELDAPDGYISFFILDILGIPRTEIKVSPSKADSTMNRVGFKDILKFINLKQKDIASDSMLSMNNAARHVKHKEVLKYLLNIHNEKISSIHAEISNNTTSLKRKESEKKGIFKFLEDTGFDIDYDYEKKLLESDFLISEIDNTINSMKKDHRLKIEFSSSVKNELSAINEHILWSAEKKKELIDNLEKYTKLKKSYLEEMKSITTTIDIEARFSIIPDKEINCPICSLPQKGILKDESISIDSLKHEKLQLKRKITGLSSLIDNTRCELSDIERDHKIALDNLDKIQSKYDVKFANEVSSLVETISLLEKEKIEILSSKKVSQRDKKIISRLDIIDEEVSNLEKIISRLETDLVKANENATNPTDVIKNLNDIFEDLMINSGLSNMSNVYIDKKMDYHVRNRAFTKLTSGGVRTITSISIFLSKLVYAINHDSNFPTLLMLDTPGNNIGRNRDSKFNDAESSDPELYENIYRRLAIISDLAKDADKEFQIIVIDNDLATATMGDPRFYIAKRFSKSDNRFDHGLIDDIRI
ncbi:hypothetical protein BCS58_14325 [Enterovibrio norvegicus]|uniref:hypothetical protein n=1 Tax=Enterovibrio norvegicus TaxID=188144 RepID=UPI003899A11B